MGMNNTPASDRIHIGFFGRRNAGKSSVLNAVTGQDLAVVSDVKGTTTDPVYKAMELLPLGPVMMIDTPGIDDEGQLGSLRVRKSYQVLNKTAVAVLVMDVCHGPASEDYALLEKIGKKQIPCVAVCNKADLDGISGQRPEGIPDSVPVLSVSAHTGQGIAALKECLAQLGRTQENSRKIVGDLLSPSDLAVLVVPIDKAAPKGRLILPQQQTIRDILEADAVTPEDILLTSFSILFARDKGSLETMVQGVRALDSIRKGDRILISEGCTHHRQCEDIGTVKLPKWIREYIGTEPEFVFTSGTEFPDELAGYHLIVHCGGCMLNEREMKYRMKCAQDQGIPMTNYGITIAYIHGILRRSVEPFPEIAALLDGSREG